MTKNTEATGLEVELGAGGLSRKVGAAKTEHQ